MEISDKNLDVDTWISAFNKSFVLRVEEKIL